MWAIFKETHLPDKQIKYEVFWSFAERIEAQNNAWWLRQKAQTKGRYYFAAPIPEYQPAPRSRKSMR